MMKRNFVALVSGRWQQRIAAAVLFSVPVLAMVWLCPGLLAAAATGPATPDLTFDAPSATLAKVGTSNKADAEFLAEHWTFTSDETQAARDLVAGATPDEDEIFHTSTTFTASTRAELFAAQVQNRRLFNQDRLTELRSFNANQKIAKAGGASALMLSTERSIFNQRRNAELAIFNAIFRVQRAQFNQGVGQGQIPIAFSTSY